MKFDFPFFYTTVIRFLYDTNETCQKDYLNIAKGIDARYLWQRGHCWDVNLSSDWHPYATFTTPSFTAQSESGISGARPQC
jgi:hypothetical protein